MLSNEFFYFVQSDSELYLYLLGPGWHIEKSQSDQIRQFYQNRQGYW